MAVNALCVANYFIEKSLTQSSQHGLTPMKLLKMIYLAHGLYLANYQKPLINEKIVAWRYGPVIETVYHTFKHYGDQDIDHLAEDNAGQAYHIPDSQNESQQMTDLLDTVWDSCQHYTGIQLSNWSHEKNGPWDKTFNQTSQNTGGRLTIDDQLIRDYFSEERV